MTDPATVEKVARAIAGDDWAAAFDSRLMQRICEGADGKYRDVNWPSKREYRDMARDALAAHEAAIKDAGMVVVPREPSIAFLSELTRRFYGKEVSWEECYRAMIAASKEAK